MRAILVGAVAMAQGTPHSDQPGESQMTASPVPEDGMSVTGSGFIYMLIVAITLTESKVFSDNHS